MLRALLAGSALALMNSGAAAEYLLLLDPTRLDAAVAARGAGPDGRAVRPRAVAAACVRDGVLGPAAFLPRLDRCRAEAAVPGLAEAVADLPVTGADPGMTVSTLVAAGGIVAVEPRRRVACRPGFCDRSLFDGVAYPSHLVGRPPPDILPVPFIQQFTITPEDLTVGEGAELSWTADGVASCRLSASDVDTVLTVAAAGSRTVAPAEDTVWTLTCAAPGGTATAQAAATVEPTTGSPEIVVFTPARDDVPIGTRTTLIWATRRAETCTLSDGSTAIAVAPSARVATAVQADTRFVLACENAAGSTAQSAEVRVTTAAAPPEIESFDLDRAAIARGDSLFARWQAPGATRCVLRDDMQATSWRLDQAGALALAPAATTAYTLSCRNAFGDDRATLSVTVDDTGEPLRITSFELSTLAGAPRGSGGALTLDEPSLVRASWIAENARACRLSDDAGRASDVAPDGSRIVRIENTTALQISCVSRSAEAQAMAQAEVLAEAVFIDDFEG